MQQNNFQFIKLLDFSKDQIQQISKALNDAINNSTPIILDNIDVFVEQADNIQIITLSQIKEQIKD